MVGMAKAAAAGVTFVFEQDVLTDEVAAVLVAEVAVVVADGIGCCTG